MNKEFFSKRLTDLRIAKGVTARDMSLSMGQNPNYINKIENKITYPTMENFFYICEFFNITPQEFFDENNNFPEQLNELIPDLKKVNSKVLSSISTLIKEIIYK